MLKKAFTMAAHHIIAAKDYVHSLGEPTAELFLAIADAINNGTLQGVEMVKQSLFLSRPNQPRAIPVDIN